MKRDQLISAGERVSENDLVIAALTGLPHEFDMIKTMILARETPISVKYFRAQLLSAESTIEYRITSLTSTMSMMYMNGDRSNDHSNGTNETY